MMIFWFLQSLQYSVCPLFLIRGSQQCARNGNIPRPRSKRGDAVGKTYILPWAVAPDLTLLTAADFAAGGDNRAPG